MPWAPPVVRGAPVWPRAGQCIQHRHNRGGLVALCKMTPVLPLKFIKLWTNCLGTVGLLAVRAPQELQDEVGARRTWERGWAEPGGSPAHWWVQACLWHLGSVSFSGVWLGRVPGDGQKGSGISPTWSGRPRGLRISGWFAGPSAERQVHLWLGGGVGRGFLVAPPWRTQLLVGP